MSYYAMQTAETQLKNTHHARSKIDKMKSAIKLLVILSILGLIGAPPVTEKKKTEDDEEKENRNKHFEEMGIEYNRYLVQVVEALESDPEFRKKLENATSEDIQNGKIAEELDFVAHNVRSKLDELKRIELERLRKLARQQYDLANDIDTAHLKVPMAEPTHLDHTNPHTFETADLKKLITKTTEDLAEADKQRRDDFKKYEMEKEFEKNQKLNELDEEKKKKYLKEVEEREKKHKKHDPLHHPGSKQQLEEVWEKQDHMENQEFDPRSFFFMHDLDGNGVWDEAEVKALFLKELDKMYEAGAPEDDMRERVEEMERMREHVFREADLNRDSLISYDEFLQQTKKPEFEKDQGWEGLDEKPVYTQDEYHEFERRRQEEIHRLIQEGKLQPPPMYHPPPPPGYDAPPLPHGYQQGNQVPYNQQQQQFQQQQVYQQQQHFQQQQQNNIQQQQQYQQQNPQHFQQQQYQPQYQQPAVNHQQPIQNNVPQNQQLPISNSGPQQAQPVQNSIPQQPPISNNIPQQQGQPLSNSIPQQQPPLVNNIPQQQQPPLVNNIPQQQGQPISNNIPQQQPPLNNSPQNPAMSNEIPKAAGGPPPPIQSNSIPQK